MVLYHRQLQSCPLTSPIHKLQSKPMTDREEIIKWTSRELRHTNPINITATKILEVIEELGYTKKSESYDWVRLRNKIARESWELYTRLNPSTDVTEEDIPAINNPSKTDNIFS